MIPYGHQDISQDDIQAVVDVLRSDFITQGPVVPRFEQAIAGYCGARHAVATSSATAALHVACLSLGVGSGDIVWTSPITFVASANCALYCGAEVDFVDIDPGTYNMSPAVLEEKLVAAEREGRLPRVVIPVHMAGQSCDMRAIAELAERYGFRIIEDASHAIGGKYAGEPVGDCRFSDICVFSFHPVKIITTGEGGMLTTNDDRLCERMQLFRSHGITRDESLMTHESDGPWYYQQIALGFNYRMTDLQAALGLSQLNRLDEFVASRQQIAEHYDESLADLSLATPCRKAENYSALHLYIVRLRLAKISKTHRQVFEHLRESGIGVNLHYIPVYHQPYYADRGFDIGYCREAERYYAEAVSLPIYPQLERAQQALVIETLREVVSP